ncbi:MAG: OsmC family protein [Ginsengibacter sp.]
MIRNATAVWQGNGKDGKCSLSTQSKVLDNAQYSYKSRFEDGAGTNPEELIAVAHAGCFTMKLSFVLQAAGFTADEIETKCAITLENGAITKSQLTVKGKIPGISKEKFDESAKDAKENCPVSKLLNTEITMEASLEG